MADEFFKHALVNKLDGCDECIYDSSGLLSAIKFIAEFGPIKIFKSNF